MDYWYGQSNNLSYSYQNNRVFGAGYDADGRMTSTAPTDGYTLSTYDAAGYLTRITDQSTTDTYRSYDGNGREVKRRKLRWDENPYSGTSPYGNWVDEGNTFYIRSSILGNETITEADKDGKKIITYVKANGATLATQSIIGTNQKVTFEHYDASGMSYRTTDGGGTNALYTGTVFSPGELDPLGNSVGLETPYVEPLQTLEPTPKEIQPFTPFLLDMDSPMYVNGQRQECSLDGMSISCSQLNSMSADSLAVGLYDKLGRQVGQLPVERRMDRLWVPSEVTFRFRARGEVLERVFISSYNVVDLRGQQREQDVPFDFEGIKRGIKKVLETPGCKELFQSLLNEVATKGNPLAEDGNIETILLSAIGQNALTRKKIPNSFGASTTGTLKDKNLSVYLPKTNIESGAKGQLLTDIMNLFNEGLHFSGRNRSYYDREFAEVVSKNYAWSGSNYLIDDKTGNVVTQPYPLLILDEIEKIHEIKGIEELNIRGQGKKMRNDVERNPNNGYWSAFWHPVVTNLCLNNVDWNSITNP